MFNQKIAGAISSQIGEATQVVLNELMNPSKVKMKDLILALDSDPVAYACCQIKSARAMQLIGNYTNKNNQIKKWVNSNIENMDGSLADLTGRLSSAAPFGFATAEIILKQLPREWKLKKFHVLNPDRTVFKSKYGYIDSVKYLDGGTEKKIPYWKVIHITNVLVNAFGTRYVYGSPELTRAYPYIRLKQLLFGELGVSAKRLATGFFWGQADSNNMVELLDSTGKPIKDSTGRNVAISSTENLSRGIQNLENHGAIITGKDDMLSVLQVPAGEQFWSLAKAMVDEQIMRSMLIPDTIWQQGMASFGVGGLATMQMSMLDSSITAIVEQIQDQIIEKVFKPLIICNFGHQESYGKFILDKSITDPNRDNTIIANLISTMSMGLIPQDDLFAVNLLREKLDLPVKTKEEQSFEKKMKENLEQLQASGQGYGETPTE